MVNQALRDAIAERFKTESDFARMIGWPRQKLSKTILGTRCPKISDLNALSKGLDIPVGEVISFFEQ